MLLDENGRIVRDARKIIYPGSQGNPWWDNKQLMDQMAAAIEIFDAAHPDCQAESQNCCMTHLLSQQEDFVDQESMLESMIKEQGHLCIFLPKFHCELNPIEMVCVHSNLFFI